MVTTHLYVEGGGDNKTLKGACRRGFRKFIEKAGVTGNMPKIVACGGRTNAYNSFRKALVAGNNTAMLLVDAEAPVTASSTWQHLKDRDGWARPNGATDVHCHLMVQFMESWFLADRGTLQTFYGQGFRTQDLPQNPVIESISKQAVLDGLSRGTRNTKSYKKGADSFQILEMLDPAKVRSASPYAEQFIQTLLAS